MTETCSSAVFNVVSYLLIDGPARLPCARTFVGSAASAGARHRRDFFLCLHFPDLVFSSLNMQRALRGGDSQAILILSINIKVPVRTGTREGFPEFADASVARSYGVADDRRQNWNRSANPAAQCRANMLIEPINIDPCRLCFVGCVPFSDPRTRPCLPRIAPACWLRDAFPPRWERARDQSSTRM
jgi:hypothetical protein